MRDIRQTSEYSKYLSTQGWLVEKKNNNYYFIKKFPLIGSVMKAQRPETLRYKDIEILSKKHRVFRIIVEPNTDFEAKGLKTRGYKPSKYYFLPSKTLEIDLKKSTTSLVASSKNDARSSTLKTKYLILKTEDKVKEYRSYWKKAVGIKRHIPSIKELSTLQKAFKNNMLMLHCYSAVEQRDQVLAGGIFLIADKTAYYWSAFTSSEGRDKLAQYKVVWEGIFWAKKKGARVFDFEGIYDSRFPITSWLGFSHFKKSFGGKEVEYPGTYTKNLLPFRIW